MKSISTAFGPESSLMAGASCSSTATRSGRGNRLISGSSNNGYSNGNVQPCFPNLNDFGEYGSGSDYERISLSSHAMEYQADTPKSQEHEDSLNVRYLDLTQSDSGSEVPATPTQISSASTLETLYAPYVRHFQSSIQAQKYLTRIVRNPWVTDDPTIETSEANAQQWVERFYHAMVDTSEIKDNPTAIGYRRFTTEKRYDEKDMVARLWILFAIVLDTCRNGARAAIEDRDFPYKREDKSSSCYEKLCYIMEALRNEKTICMDVMEGGSNLYLLAAAPVGYTQKKVDNRNVNNRKKWIMAAGRDAKKLARKRRRSAA